MHIGKGIPDYKKPDLYLHNWEMQEVQDVVTGNIQIEETYEESQKTKESHNEKYLGQILSSDGSNTQNISNLANKGRGMVNTITNILNNMPGGKYHFELEVIFRNAYLISSMLSCCEVWYHITENEMRKLEQVD